MKNIRIIFSVALCMVLAVSCFKEPTVQGYLGENIRLQGGDTLATAIGIKTSTATAFLDNSTKPGVFKIEKVKDKKGNNVEAFFKHFDTNVWNTPYDFLTDTTLALVSEKLTLVPMTPLMINETNGQLYTMESTAQIGINPGDIFHVDVSYTNSKGTAYIEDYAILKFEAGASVDDFELVDMVNGISLLDQGNNNKFPLYAQVNSSGDKDFNTNYEKLMKGEKVKGMTIKRIGEKKIGVQLWLQFFDEAGNLFDPEGYGRYSTTESFISYGLDRVNRLTPVEGDPAEAFGMGISFPYTPWPVYSGTFYSYIRSAQYENFEHLDYESLKADFAKNVADGNTSVDTDFYDSNNKPTWPKDSYFSGKWYVRFRCAVKFTQPGIYLIKVEIPYVSAVNKNGKN